MAIAQRPIPSPFSRPAARPAARPAPRPAPRTLPRPSRRAATRSLAGPLVVAGAFALFLIVYVSGHALMAGVNYQKVRLLRQMQSLQASHQILHSEVIVARNKEAVEAWAKAHGMVRVGADSMIVASSAQGGR